ncbi:MAG: aromatic amino acid lyase [Mesosutterella sp.]|nr:aromatic amino acid lyase [Mesosutterella sp.]
MMKFKPAALAIGLAMTATSAFATVTLDGHSLTQADAWKIAEGEPVAISDKALKFMSDSNKLVLLAARQGKEIYGLTVGVGLNKDHHLFDKTGRLTEQARQASIAFNRNIIRSHSAGFGPMLDKKIARLAMVVRLNTLLTGRSGAQPRVAELYRDFLNKGITPMIPSRGSIGDADITLASHVGSVMIGEWKADVDGREMTGAEALKAKGLQPLVPEGKDGLAILSSNCVGTALTMEAARTMHQVLKVSPVVYGLSLEGLNGNVTPFLAQSAASHPLKGFPEMAKTLRLTLKGSYLWDLDKTRNLQDPLSFRTSVYTMSEAKVALDELDGLLNTQINSSDDNPGVILNATQEDRSTPYVNQWFVEGDGLKGAIIPSANFEPLPIAIAAQKAAIALTHVAHNSANRMMRLDDDNFSGLSRYLASKENVFGHAFGATEDSMVSLYAETIDLANPISVHGAAVEGTIEDTHSNLPRVAQRLNRSANTVLDMYSMELLHAAQAIDLRKMKQTNVRLSDKTGALYNAYRKQVPFVGMDRVYSGNLQAGRKILEQY